MARKKVSIETKIKVVLNVPIEMSIEEVINKFESDIDYDFKMKGDVIKVSETKYIESKDA